jgi:exonuclease SbcD
VIIIGGNHDSPSLLEAPRELLRLFQIHVIGRGTESPEDEVIILKDGAGRDKLIICAIPYLRDRDIRLSRAGETTDEKSDNLIQGITAHYRSVCALAKERQTASPDSPPIVATGHMFTAGGHRVDGDGVRDLYVGSLAHVDAALLPDYIDYLALGHLHSPQKVGESETRRYCGSPLPMSFSEAKVEKCVLLVNCAKSPPDITTQPVPCFQKLSRLNGSLEDILTGIEILKTQNESIWLEIIYDGEEIIVDLQTALREAIKDSDLEILRIVNNRIVEQILQQSNPDETLENMSEEQVFQRCLDAHNTPATQQPELLQLFRETLRAVHEDDENAE